MSQGPARESVQGREPVKEREREREPVKEREREPAQEREPAHHWTQPPPNRRRHRLRKRSTRSQPSRRTRSNDRAARNSRSSFVEPFPIPPRWHGLSRRAFQTTRRPSHPGTTCSRSPSSRLREHRCFVHGISPLQLRLNKVAAVCQRHPPVPARICNSGSTRIRRIFKCQPLLRGEGVAAVT